MGARARAPHWPACCHGRAAHRCLLWPPVPTGARVSTAQPWTPCSSPCRSFSKVVQYAGRILRPHLGKTTAEIHDYHDLHTSSHRISGQTRPRYTSIGLPDPRRPRPPYTPSSGGLEGSACTRSDSRSVGRSRPRRLEAQPLLKHKRQSYGSWPYTALNGHRTLTCLYLDMDRSARLSRRLHRPLPRQTETRSERPGLTCEHMGGRSRVRTWVG
jgi:hypothetical protein